MRKKKYLRLFLLEQLSEMLKNPGLSATRHFKKYNIYRKATEEDTDGHRYLGMHWWQFFLEAERGRDEIWGHG